MNRQEKRALEAQNRRQTKRGATPDEAAKGAGPRENPIKCFYALQEEITGQVVKELFGDDPAFLESVDKVFAHSRGQHEHFADLVKNLSDKDGHQGRSVAAMRQAVENAKRCFCQTSSPRGSLVPG